MNFLRLLFNKYMLTLAGFGVWMLFLDRNDWMSQQDAKAKLQGLQENIQYLNREIEVMDSQRIARLNNPEALEKFARERYRMKRDGEDLYVLQP